MHQLSRRSIKLSNFLEKCTQRRDDHAAINTCVDSSMCIEHIINLVRHRVKLIKRLKIEGSVKPVSETLCMKSGLNGAV
jgi:hypothetical protein